MMRRSVKQEAAKAPLERPNERASQAILSDSAPTVEKATLRQKAFDLIPVIIMTLQFVVLIYMMVTNWFNKDPPEMPYKFTTPLGSLGLGVIMFAYNFFKYNQGKVPGTVLVVNGIWLVVTLLLCGLAYLFPERQCCCPGGVKANKVDMDSCENKDP